MTIPTPLPVFSLVPANSVEIPDEEFVRAKCAVPTAYQKFCIIESGKKDLPIEKLEESAIAFFSCMLDSRQIAASTLVGKDLVSTQIKHGDSYPKSMAVNCYAFACGRAPLSAADDPVPGAFYLEHVRAAIFKKISPNTTLDRGERLNQALAKTEFNVNRLIVSDQDIKAKIDRFTQAFFNQEASQLSEEEMQTFKGFLTNNYQVPSDYQNAATLDRLLSLDGLEKLDFNKQEKEYKAGTHLLAAFVNPNSDYHFIRYFSDGWYERVGDLIRKRAKAPQDTLHSINNRGDIPKAFPPEEGASPVENFSFVGYYLVPSKVEVADKVGRKYIFEGNRIPLKRSGSSSSLSSASATRPRLDALSSLTRRQHPSQPENKNAYCQTEQENKEASCKCVVS